MCAFTENVTACTCNTRHKHNILTHGYNAQHKTIINKSCKVTVILSVYKQIM